MTIQTTNRAGADLDIAAENRGGIEYPLNHILNAAGAKIDPATEATLAALSVIAAAVQSAVEAIEAKTTAVNTGAIAGTVAVSGLPLPTGAATEATLAALSAATGAHDGLAVDGRTGMVVFVRRRDSDAEPMVDDGDLTYLNIDEEGRLKVASKPASYPDITGSITAVQATIGTPVVGGTVAGDVSRASNVMAFCSGAFSTVNCTFEGSLEAAGDTNWFGIQAIRSNANTIETATGNLSAQPVYAWEMSVNALKRVRVRCTARTSGTQNWRLVLGTYATEPIPGAQASATQPISGTVTSNLATPTASNINSAATTNATVIKGSAGTLYSINAFNNGGAAAYVKLYNKATAPTVGTDIPVLVIPVPAGDFNKPLTFGPLGHRFTAGIGLAITGGAADNDTTAVAASQVKALTGFV